MNPQEQDGPHAHVQPVSNPRDPPPPSADAAAGHPVALAVVRRRSLPHRTARAPPLAEAAPVVSPGSRAPAPVLRCMRCLTWDQTAGAVDDRSRADSSGARGR